MHDARIPVVDIGGFAGGDAPTREAIAREWDAALSSVGFAIVVNHSIPDAAAAALHGAASGFFGLPDAEKEASNLHQGYGKGGFVPVGVEAVARSRPEGAGAPADLVENLVFSHGGDVALESVVPRAPPSLQPAVAAYWSHATALLRTLMELSAVALSLPADHFDACFASPKCNLRLAHYPALADGADAAERAAAGAVRYGAHTDYTGFTILRQDPRADGQLEAQLATGEWVPVPARPGAMVVNAGDLIQVWTNDRWRSPPHRVRNPPAGADTSERLSVVFFTGPADDTVVEALPSCHGPGRPKKYEPVSARGHLLAKLGRSNTGAS